MKVGITRFGGSSSYRAATPLFLGLGLGDVLLILVWLLVAGWQGRTNHYLVPTQPQVLEGWRSFLRAQRP